MTIGDTRINSVRRALSAQHRYEIGAWLAAAGFIGALGGGAQKEAIAWIHLVHCFSFMEIELALQYPDPVPVECIGRGRKRDSGARWELHTNQLQRQFRLG